MADTTLRVPLLLYIDDNQRGDTAKLISLARRLSVHVRSFKSTHELEVWVGCNIDFLKKHNTGAPGNIRAITDAIHPNNNNHLDTEAGQRVARYFRQHLNNIPILVKTAHNYIEHTRFVKDMWLTGSTCSYDVAKEYIEQLAGVMEHNCSVNWAQFNAH